MLVCILYAQEKLCELLESTMNGVRRTFEGKLNEFGKPGLAKAPAAMQCQYLSSVHRVAI